MLSFWDLHFLPFGRRNLKAWRALACSPSCWSPCPGAQEPQAQPGDPHVFGGIFGSSLAFELVQGWHHRCQFRLLCVLGACRHQEPGLVFPATKKVKNEADLWWKPVCVAAPFVKPDREYFQELKNSVIRKLSVGDLKRKRKDCKYERYHTWSVVASKKSRCSWH